jgi:type IV pilus assembly protein PilE
MLRKQSGMTLMEVMTVVVIIGILTAIAYPSYRAQVRRSNRTEARVALEQSAGALEKCYTRYMAYNDNANCPAANQFNAGAGYNTARGLYRVTGNFPDATRFTLTATALGGQLSDTGCTALTIDHTGTRGPAACW